MTTALKTTLGGIAALVLLASCGGMVKDTTQDPQEPPVTAPPTPEDSILGSWVRESAIVPFDDVESAGIRRTTITFTATDSDAAVGRKRWVSVTEDIPNERGIAAGWEYRIWARTGEWTATDSYIERTIHDYDHEENKLITSVLRKNFRWSDDDRTSLFLLDWLSDDEFEDEYELFDKTDTPSFVPVSGTDTTTTWQYRREFGDTVFTDEMTFGSDGTFYYNDLREVSGVLERSHEYEGTFEHVPENYLFRTTLSVYKRDGVADDDADFLKQTLVWSYMPHDSDSDGVADTILVSPWWGEMAWNAASEAYEVRTRVERDVYWMAAVIP